LRADVLISLPMLNAATMPARSHGPCCGVPSHRTRPDHCDFHKRLHAVSSLFEAYAVSNSLSFNKNASLHPSLDNL
jgi:hypothetical protein